MEITITRNDFVHKPRETAEKICDYFLRTVYKNYDPDNNDIDCEEIRVKDERGFYVCELSIDDKIFNINTADISIAHHITSHLYKENILDFYDLLSIVEQWYSEDELDEKQIQETYNNLKYQ